MEWTDEAAVASVKSGDTDAFRTLVERHSRSVFRLAYRMIGNEQDAEDVVQESFLRAFRQLQYFDGRASFRTWLYRIVANCSLDVLRKNSRSRQSFSGSDDGMNDFLLSVPATDPTPDRIAQSSQMREHLDAAMQTLTPTERSAFVLRHFEGLSIEDISGILACGPVAARHSIFRAVQKLRRALQPVMGGTR